ncbi:MAG TPA: TrkA family potassium uptake protein [Pseudothermotoga sp.]|nr:TrkA family potassium uptake protein [Pseudothermotoga sp.]HOK83850.1 TrkA family potassium uptake protein [Pseudothermotoga sp.]HPP70247.1 TrkA family potassium uptake protein [Pseudothermotoga sp.]
MKKRAESLYMIIVGCGRIGSIVASQMSASGNNVVVIDNREVAFDNLSEEFTGFKILGDATEIVHLKETKIERADVVLALTGDDNTNFMVSTVAKQYFGVKEVIARVNDPDNEDIFKEFDIEVISPTALVAEKIIQRVDVGGQS